MKEYKIGRWLRTGEKTSDKIQYIYFIIMRSHLGEVLYMEKEQGMI